VQNNDCLASVSKRTQISASSSLQHCHHIDWPSNMLTYAEGVGEDGVEEDVSVLRWVQTCNVTAYLNAVSRHCRRDSWPRNVSKVGYAVSLRACLVPCRYLVVASKGWYVYGLSRSERATWRVTIVRSSPLLSIPDVSVLKSGANL